MQDKESQTIEFKPNWRDEYLKVLSSFANGKGGVLKIGVDDRGNPIGLQETNWMLENLPNKIRNKFGIIPSVEIEKKNHTEIPVEKLKTNHLSKPRNTLLAEIFYYAGFIESWGRGR